MNVIFYRAGIVALIFLLVGCSTNRAEDQSVNALISQFWEIKSDAELSPEQIQQSKYALIEASVDGHNTVLMPLGYLKGSTQRWFSQDLASIVTSEGRVIGIYNILGYENLTGLFPDKAFQRLSIHKVGLNQVLEMPLRMDLPSIHRFGIPVYVKIQTRALEKRQYFGRSVELLRVEETVKIPSLDFEHINLYWKHPKDHFIWESKQKWAPNLPKVHYKVLKAWKEVAELE